MTCFDKARELGAMLLETEEAIRLADATAVYNESKAAQAKMNAYIEKKEAIQQKARNQEYKEGEYAEAAHELSHMAAELKRDPVIGAMLFAENEFNGMVNRVMSVLRSTITGQEEPDCGGSCNSCSGCGQ